MLVQNVSLSSQKNTVNSFNGNGLFAGLDICQERLVGSIAEPLLDTVKNASCDLFIIQHKRKGIVKIIAQKMHDYKAGRGKKVEKTLHVKNIKDNNMYLTSAKEVVQKYEKPAWYKKLYLIIKNKLSNKNN